MKKWYEIDALYALGTLLVVLGHSHSSDWSTFDGTILYSVIIFVYTFHMPLFFFIAGFLFINSKSFGRDGYKKWIINKAKKLMIPYIFLSVGALIPKYFVEHHGFSGFTIQYLVKTILAPRMGVWGHFWFLPVLLILYFGFGLWRKNITEKNYHIMFFGTLIISIVLYFMSYKTYWMGFSDLKENTIFFVFGMITNIKVCECRKYLSTPLRILWILGAVVTSIFFVKNFYHSKFVMLIEAILMISACWQVAIVLGENKYVKYISIHNFTIYIYSWPFQAISMALCDKLGLSWYLTTVCMFSTGLCIPLLMIVVYGKIKKLHNRFFDLLLGIK